MAFAAGDPELVCLFVVCEILPPVSVTLLSSFHTRITLSPLHLKARGFPYRRVSPNKRTLLCDIMETNISANQAELILGLLSKLDQRLESIETRLQDVEGLPKQPTLGFPQFRRLPIELRLRIWDMTIPQRKLFCYFADDYHIFDDNNQPGYLPVHKLSPPVVSQICKESRSVALRRGRLFWLFWRDENYLEHGYWSWFDGSHDVLELGTPGCAVSDDIFPKFGCCSELLQYAESILVHIDDIGPWAQQLYTSCPSLKTINIQLDIPERVEKDNCGPRVIAALFAHTSVVMVDVYNLEEVRHVQRILLYRPAEYEGDFASKCDTKSWKKRSAKRQRRKMKRFDVEWAIKVFKKAWIRHKTDPAEESPTWEDWDWDKRVSSVELESAMSTLSKGMPRIRIVKTLEFLNEGQMGPGGKPWFPAGEDHHPLALRLSWQHQRDPDLDSEDDLEPDSD